MNAHFSLDAVVVVSIEVEVSLNEVIWSTQVCAPESVTHIHMPHSDPSRAILVQLGERVDLVVH